MKAWLFFFLNVICWVFIFLPETCLSSARNIGKVSPGFKGSQMQFIDDEGLFLVSNNSNFGFGFNPNTDITSFTIVIIHIVSSRVVWSANRGVPLGNTDNFVFGDDGDAYIQSNGKVIWSTNTAGKGVSAMELLDSGNLVLVGDDGGFIWESFSHPTNTLMPNQEFSSGSKLVSNPKNNLTFSLEIKNSDMILSAGFHNPQSYWAMSKDNRRIINKDGGKMETATINGNTWKFFDQNKVFLWQFVFADGADSNITWAAVLEDDGFIRFYNLPGKVTINIAIPDDTCSTPNACSPYLVCHPGNTCLCPSGLNEISCKPTVLSCAMKDQATLISVGENLSYSALGYTSPSSKTTLDGCKTSCLGNCSCLAMFFDNKSGNCYLFDQIGSFEDAKNGESFESYVKIPRNLNGKKKKHSIVVVNVDTIFSNQTLEDGETLVSEAEVFELGFFGPETSSFRYLGIWYKKVSVGTIVWVANREAPLNDPTGVLKISEDGSLELRSVGNTLIWSSESSKPSKNINPVARILDTGNLVIKDDISGDIIWQSFDHPGDTWLPGMKIGVDLVTGITWNLTSWKSSEDPSSGSYTVWMDSNGYPQLYNMKDESSFQQRIGYWNGLGFTGMRGIGQNRLYAFDFVLTHEEVSCNYTVFNSSIITRMILDQKGRFDQLIWIPGTQEWVVYMSLAVDSCDSYGACGPYGSCNINNSPVCGCLRGFEPKLPEEWDVADWKNGCKRKISTIDDGNEFMKFNNLKLPDSRDAWFNISMSLEQCRNFCARNVSCTAYANIDVRGNGSGCLQWSSELLDMRGALEKDVSGQDIYIKMSNPSLIRDQKKKNRKKSYLVVIMSIVSAMILLVFGTILYAWRKKKKLHLKAFVNKNEKQDSELPLFSLSKIIKATSNFSINNKLGQGGFGEVYKGVLDEGVEIAVKRLSKTSRQGLAEFQNEIICIAKLQHRNLVKLLGYCLQGEEMMLIYEYMPNKSLDSFLFDENNSLSLDWHQRFHIINGIARGLLYLHQDSRLRIIHRDLKASNILLDSNMNPKISDFGLARTFKEYETEANTNKVVGTLGYISPEYASNGLFSVKSDIFSFGVLVLEIVSGKKNRGFSHQDHHDNLLGHAWRLFKEDKPIELADIALRDSWINSEVLQSIHVGLSCVQQHAEDRPSMSSVIHMLSGEGALPPPQPPGFFTQVPQPEIRPNLIVPEVLVSVNEVTITQFDAR